MTLSPLGVATPRDSRCLDTFVRFHLSCRGVMTDGDNVTGVPNQPKTPQHSVRVSDELWAAAKKRAESEGRSLSEVVRIALDAYVKGKGKRFL